MPRVSQPADLVGSIRDGIARQLRHGHPGIDSVAVSTGINVRTLQRRLAAVGLTYSRIVDQVRLEAALSLLEDRGLTLAEIASALAYADPAHFTRAFVRWTGTTPGAYRCRGERKPRLRCGDEQQLPCVPNRKRKHRNLSSNGK
jgi:AraC-like DNA-binding protein